VSMFPCDVHHQRIRGPLDAIYLALLRGTDRVSRRLRVCPEDRSAILAEFNAEWVLSTDDDQVEFGFDNCHGCKSEVTPAASWAGFVTVYAKGSERADYFTLYCDRCASESIQRFGLIPTPSRA